MRIAGFDWDAGNLEKCRAHSVSIDEIETLLSGSPRIVRMYDIPSPSNGSSRWGRGREERAIFIAFTLRLHEGSVLIRPISARYMHRKESDAYGETRAEDDER